MRRLPFAGKFLLLAVIACSAIVLLMVSLYQQQQQAIQRSAFELVGLERITEIATAIRVLEDHRGAALAAPHGLDSELWPERTGREEIAREALQQFASRLPKNTPLANHWDAISEEWTTLAKQIAEHPVIFSRSFEEYSELIGRLLNFAMSTSDHYGVSADPDLHIFYLGHGASMSLLNLVESLARIRGYGTYLLVQGERSTANIAEFQRLLTLAQRDLDGYRQVLDRSALYNPKIASELQDRFGDLASAVRMVLEYSSQQILLQGSNGDPQHYYTTTTALVNLGYAQLIQQLLPEAMGLIQARIHEAQVQMWAQGVIALLLLLTALYFMIGAHFAAVGPLKRIGLGLQRFATGDLDQRIQLEGNDEFARIGRHMNAMAADIKHLIEQHQLAAIRMGALFEASLDALIQLDEQGNVARWSPQAERIFGWSDEEILGYPLHEFIIPERFRARHLRSMQAYLATRQSTQLNRRMEISALRRTNHGTQEEFPVELTVTAVKVNEHIEFHAFVRDISERKHTEEELRIAAAAFDAHEAIMITDANAVILRVNRSFERITGYRADEVIGKTPKIFHSGKHDAAFYQKLWQSLLTHDAWSGEIWDRHKDGSIYPKQTTITTVRNPAGEVTQFVSIFADISARKRAEAEIHNLAYYDSLTSLPNRSLLLTRLNAALQEASPGSYFGALLFLDLDNFKTLNDTLGHDYGDQLLAEVAQRLRLGVRETDTVARFGGDEFVVLLKHLVHDENSASQAVAHVAEKIRSLLAAPYQIGAYTHHSTPSIGICLFGQREISAEAIIKQADMAMYQAKNAGRNCFRFFDPSIQHALEARVSLENDLRKAIQQDELQLHYQPQVDFNGRIIGAEALIRWRHPEQGMISPARFIPIAEESTLILEIGDWVLETACQQLQHWSATPLTAELTLAVNISAQQFKKLDFVEHIEQQLRRYAIRDNRLKLELTENMALDDLDFVIAKMLALRHILHVPLSLDDFGTGYSSLSYLKRLPLDQLKIDQSFMRNLISDSGDAVMVKTIIELGHNFGLDVIAEGVESEAQLALLKQLGCRNFQGYFFGKPMASQDFLIHLQRQSDEPMGSTTASG